ncbi:ARM repeat-containing protein [Macroventuria anomochaeta]|uniref:ARM repeat-containing protein n=1 Tax=Macroventuria anomochaeta TaxID=301207 RepID=A0ACB6SCM8_9PLEO|nr:ARM repeat-containing protein [Macroventuria anomochaeta]KAF2631966.1 ARM repeat-containing protein [Macroventuria anomochaeta]
MSSISEEERALQLAQAASESLASGDLAAAAMKLREATSIAPENAQIKEVWEKLRQEEDRSEFLAICKAWVQSKDEADGERALKSMKERPLKQKEAEQAMQILNDFKDEDDVLDQVTGELLKNVGAQTWLAQAVRERPTRSYYELFPRGDDSIDGLLKVLLNRSLWPDDDAFKNSHRDVFQLSLAMLMEEALDHPERAMRGVAQLLAHHANHLENIIDADSFNVILSSLDIRLPKTLRDQATLASIKLFELSPDTAKKLISKFVTERAEKGDADNLIIAFSAAAAIFPIAVEAAAALFLTDGFVSTLVPVVEKKKSHKLVQVTLELISAACVDKKCREAINRHCRDWLDMVADSPDKGRANLAALILVKLGDEEPPSSENPQVATPAKFDQSDLIAKFKSMVISSDAGNTQDSIEGLAYASLQAKFREGLSEDSQFLKRLMLIMGDPDTPGNIIFGGLTIFANITAFLPIQSDEEKRMAQLKAYANVQKPSAPDDLLDDNHATARCKRLVEAGVVPLLAQLCKKRTANVLSQSSQILLNLSRDKTSRVLIVQQGAIRLLIVMWEHMASAIASSKTGTTPFSPTAPPAAAQALSRLLISVDPRLTFSAALPPTTAVRPLQSQLSRTESSAWQLYAFEALLALTNLATLDETTQTHIIRAAFDRIVDDLLLSNNTMLQRAATQLVCNLMGSPYCVEKFADGSPRAKHRLHLLLAMTDVEDTATRSAAGGALATLLSCGEITVMPFLQQEKGVDFLIGLCQDDEDELQHRGVVCLQSVGEVPAGLEVVKRKGGVGAVMDVQNATNNRVVIDACKDALAVLKPQ